MSYDFSQINVNQLMDIKLVISDPNEKLTPEFSATMTNFESQEVIVMLNFSNSLEISKNRDLDYLIVKIK